MSKDDPQKKVLKRLFGAQWRCMKRAPDVTITQIEAAAFRWRESIAALRPADFEQYALILSGFLYIDLTKSAHVLHGGEHDIRPLIIQVSKDFIRSGRHKPPGTKS